MKKSLIALAALAATSAFAQSSVTLYGIVEATVDVGYNKTTDVVTTVRGFNGAGVALNTITTGAVGLAITGGNLTLGTSPATINTATGAVTFGTAGTLTGTTTARNERRNGFRMQDGNDQGSGTSRVGFRGTEDLGGGMKANFQLEMGIRVDDGAVTNGSGNAPSSGNSGGNVFGRNAWGGISGGFGEVRLGRQVLGSFGVQGNSWAAGSSNGLYDAGAGTAPAMGGVRFSNAIRYITPNFSGFTGSLMFAAPETEADTFTSNSAPNAIASGNLVTTTNASRRTGVDLALEYANGPAYIGFGYNKRDAGNGTSSSSALATNPALALISNVAAAGGTITGYTLGGSYDLGVAKPFINYTRETQTVGGSTSFVGTTAATSSSFINAGNSTVRAYSIGVRAPFGATTLIASYGNAKTSGNGSTVATSAAGSQSFIQTLESTRSAFQIGAQYALSKRTLLEANYGYNKIAQDQSGRQSASPVLPVTGETAVTTVRTNDRVSAFNVGLKHSF
jgi:predicted porin